MKRLLLRSAACAALAVTSVARAQDKPITLAVDGRASSNPTIAADGQYVTVVWSGATVQAMDIFAATSRDGGKTFGTPVQVNNVAGDARVSGEEPPRVALVPHKGGAPDVVVVWTAKAGTSTKLLSARSNDGGKTFSAANSTS